MIEAALATVEKGGTLTLEQTAGVMGQIMDGRGEADAIARLLTALHRRGETVEEVAGAALAPAGCPVAKHGNRAATSRSGSADVLAALGVNIEADAACVEACLEELGLCFCFAPLWHSAMRHVAPIRKRLGTPTIFNILGPLANPASAPYQLLGVGRAGLQPLLAEALLRLGARRVVVVHGSDGLDEVTLGGATDAVVVEDGRQRRCTWSPEDFGARRAGLDALRVEGPAESAEVIRGILAGRPGPPRDIVAANAAAALWTARRRPTIAECVALARAAIDSGAAAELLRRLIEKTRKDA